MSDTHLELDWEEVASRLEELLDLFEAGQLVRVTILRGGIPAVMMLPYEIRN